MRKYIYLIVTIALLSLGGCQRDVELDYEDNQSTGNVEDLGNGRVRVEVSLASVGMTSISTRMSDTSYEDRIYNGWCLVFGQTDAGENLTNEEYGDDSPLLQIVPITANEAGTFFMTFDEYEHKSFIRIAVNLTERENRNFESVMTWHKLASENPELNIDLTKVPSHDDVVTYRDDESYKLATFGEYRHQSVGLDGIYNIDYNTTTQMHYYPEGFEDYSGATTYYCVNYQNQYFPDIVGENYITKEAESYNGNKPNPTTQLNTTKGFPMSSYGFILNELTKESIKEAFGTTIEMIRSCSKVVVDVKDDSFSMSEVYLLDGAQESRIRSTIMNNISEDGQGNTTADVTKLSVPVDLGGVIDYQALTVSGSVSDPIYFYPNSGGDYVDKDGAVNQTINPQYIIIKGQSSNYDTPGFYKVALKAQYPLVKDADPNAMDDRDQWSSLTYDILRNTSFKININNIDKAGYKTYEDAADVNSPANNISYSITIESSNNHYEVLVSKGTYYVELASSRIYAKGYGDEGIEGDNVYVDFTMFPSEDNVVPAVYIQSSDYDGVDSIDNVAIKYCKVLREGDTYYASGVNGVAEWDKVTETVEPEANNTGDNLAANLVHIKAKDETDAKRATKVRVYFKATNSGRIRLRIGDILKFIPIVYEKYAIQTEGETMLKIEDEYGTQWSNFAFTSDNYVENLKEDGIRILKSDGSTTDNSGNYKNTELITRIFTSDNSGIAQLYLRQASDFELYTYYDNSANSATGGVLGSNIFSEPVDNGLTSSYTTDIKYQSTGKIYNMNGVDVGSLNNELIMTSWKIGDAAIEFTTQGDFTSSISNSLTDKFIIDGDWSNLHNGEKVTLKAKNIGHNQIDGEEYDSSRARVNSASILTLTNIAGQTKSYTMNLEQYTLPYVDNDVTYDSSTSTYTWLCPLVADINWSWGGNNEGDYVDSPTIYNNRYYSKTDGAWSWSQAPTDGSWGGGSNGVKYVTKAFKIVPTPDPQSIPTTDNQTTFRVTVYDDDSTIRETWQAYFDIKVPNGAYEAILFRMRLRRDD